MKIAIVTGSTRPNRNNIAVARWVLQLAAGRSDATFALVDIADHRLPLLDEPRAPFLGGYVQAHTKRWAETIASFDGYVFVTPEYNHGISGALKNAIDFLFAEWHHKACGFVGYGGTGGVRAVEHLRLVMGNLLVADVTAQVALSLTSDFEDSSVFKPRTFQQGQVHAMLDEVIAWSGALRSLRMPRSQRANGVLTPAPAEATVGASAAAARNVVEAHRI